MIYIIHKILELLKTHLNYFKDSIFECAFKEYNRVLLFLKRKYIFSQQITMKNSRPEE